jgi:hypothetical protein
MKKINTYTELVAERKRVEGNIAEQKSIILEGINEVKEKFEPFLYLLPLLNIFKKKESNRPLLKNLASLGIDLLVGQNLLAKSGWLARLIVPVLLKGISAKVIGGIKANSENSTQLQT